MRNPLPVEGPGRVTVVIMLLAFPVEAPAVISAGQVSDLGTEFFVDEATFGGGQLDSEGNPETLVFERDFGPLEVNPTVTASGLAVGMPSGGNTNGNVLTATITYLGTDGAPGGGDDVVLGSVTDTLDITADAGVYVWPFADPISAVVDGTNSVFRIELVSDPSDNGGLSHNFRINTKRGSRTPENAKLTIAGAASGGAPLVVRTASGAGCWDTLCWNSAGEGPTSGDLTEADVAAIGRNHEVEFRGIPVSETVASIQLGESSDGGQGRLRVTSGTLHTTRDLVVGAGDPENNDSFVFVDGGELHVGKDADFGRSVPFVDGALILSGGTFRVDRHLRLGDYAKGGSILRFHNPGSSPPVTVGGNLVLGRVALDLTFDSGYVHTPGSVITLVEYGSREGQFANFRRGDEFNCGPHRFRIDYDVPGSGPSSIRLTALENWDQAASPPNIVLVLADDQGYADFRPHDHPDHGRLFPMPVVESLAAAGARFSNAYVTGGTCHPSRCAILSGVHQCRLGNENNLWSAHYVDGLPQSVRTIPRRLQGVGYRTYGIGKWHLGFAIDFHPAVRGFDRWCGFPGSSRSYWEDLREYNVLYERFVPDYASENGDYLTDRIGDKAVEFIEESVVNHSGQPFFLWVSFTSLHAPMDIDVGADGARYAELKTRLETEFGLQASDYSENPPSFPGYDPATVAANRQELAAMTLALDENIGKIIQKLDAEGIADNTIILYLNDNGGGGVENFSCNSPLAGEKGSSMREGSIRVPCVMKWPGTINPAGRVIPDPVSSLDFMATLLHAGNAPPAARHGLDGLDLSGLLRGQEPLPAERVLTWREGGVTAGGSAIRHGRWKLVVSDALQTEELYDLSDDVGESINVIGQFPEIAADLRARFAAWEAATLPPLFGPNMAWVDAGLERHAIAGGFRVKETSGSWKHMSAPFRQPVDIDEDFHCSFFVRSSELNHGPNARLGYGLGDSDARATLILFGIDFSTGELLISEGKSGAFASAGLLTPPASFEEAFIDWNAGSGMMTFRLADSVVSLALSGTYSDLTHFSVGASGMEGELTSLRPGTGSAIGESARIDLLDAASGTLRFELEFDALPPFTPVATRSTAADFDFFRFDPDALVESLGGGRLRITTTRDPAAGGEFFKFRFTP